jgi:hypothetical protein
MATEVMAAVTQWRRQAHNKTIKYAAAKDNDGNRDGNNYNEDDEATLTAVVVVKGMTMKKDSGGRPIAPTFTIFSGVGRPVSDDLS